MNQEVNPVTALLIVLVALALGALAYWARGESVRVGGPDQMQTVADGSVYLHVAGTLYHLNPALDLNTSFKLADLGVHDLVGDFAFFSNGDMLVRRGHFEPGLWQSFLRFLRKPENKPPVASQADEGLFRCDPASKQCTPFGAQVDFDGPFHLSIDPKTDAVFISDTERHVLRKYDQNGVQLAVSREDYFFPNQNLLHDGGLLVADTNNHAIEFAVAETEGFGRIQGSYSIFDPSLADDIWPYALALVGDQWWVNNMDHTMSNGTVAMYDPDWTYTGRADLPANADPINMAVLEDRVLITDLANIAIYQLDHLGAPLRVELPDVLEAQLDSLRGDQRYYRALSYGAAFLLVLLIVGGFITALVPGFRNSA